MDSFDQTLTHPPRRPRQALAVLGLALLGWLGSNGTAQADVVTTWNEQATNAIAAAPPGERASAGIHWAMVHIAIYDAVNAIDGHYRRFMVNPSAPRAGASQEAAAAAAAYGVLRNLFPSQAVPLDAAYANSLAAIAPGTARDRGVALGAEVAAAVLAARVGDGRLTDVPYVFGFEPGDYQLTLGVVPSPPLPPGPVTPWVAEVRPFALRSGAQFRPEGPPRLDSHQYANDFNEVKSMGRADPGSPRTAAQTEIARFHTMNPTLFWGRNLKAFVAAQNLSVADNARLMAQLFVSWGDANIACWNAKYHFKRWRPVTAIHLADLDGNADTLADSGWAPPVVTPPHPEYPAAHGCAAGASMEALRQFFGTKQLAMSFTSSVTGQTHSFTDTQQFLDEIADARVFGGMHFRFSVDDGEELGKRVARYVARHAFAPVHGCDDEQRRCEHDDEDDDERGEDRD
jgi:hypothetical protein